jgi:hypothetical protein
MADYRRSHRPLPEYVRFDVEHQAAGDVEPVLTEGRSSIGDSKPAAYYGHTRSSLRLASTPEQAVELPVKSVAVVLKILLDL